MRLPSALGCLLSFRDMPQEGSSGDKNDIYDHDRGHTLLLDIYKVEVSRPNKAPVSSSIMRMAAAFVADSDKNTSL